MITGKILRDAIISGANAIINNKSTVDELNVFPVPDGDTGTNMSMTIGAAKKELETLPDDVTVEKVASTTASCMLRGARGNSGVISSLLFRGFSKALKGKETAGAKDLTDALRKGVDGAYKAVMQPTEGTILTVAREACEKAESLDTEDEVRLWQEVVIAAEQALEKTPEMLPVLKKAGVVDAGGQGLVFIFTGMLSVFRNGVIVAPREIAKKEEEFSATGVFSKDIDKKVENGYRVEFSIHKGEKTRMDRLRAYIESIGDDIVIAEIDELVKVHLHTQEPGRAITEGLKHGQLTAIKVINVAEKVSDLDERGTALEKQANDANTEKEFKYMAVDESIDFGFVAVAAGEGLINTFRDLGVDAVVTGGQTMNPSTEDILDAAQSIPAKTIFVLPNNKNIIMAAEQAAQIADRKLIVIPTRTIPQGITAMLNFDPDRDAKTNAMNMDSAARGVKSGSVTFAARNSDFEGQNIKRGDILAMENSKLAFVDKDIEGATAKLIRQMSNKDTSFITIIYGEGISREDADKLLKKVEKRAGKNAEITLINGGQPVYYYLIGIE